MTGEREDLIEVGEHLLDGAAYGALEQYVGDVTRRYLGRQMTPATMDQMQQDLVYQLRQLGQLAGVDSGIDVVLSLNDHGAVTVCIENKEDNLWFLQQLERYLLRRKLAAG